MRRWRLILSALIGLVLMAGCGGGSSTPPPPPPPPPPLAITSNAPPAGTLNTDYGTFQLTASGGKAPYSWSWAANGGEALPPGLTLASNGAISGMPTQAGAYDLTITAADSQSPAAKTSLPYTISVFDPKLLTITSTPPDGTALAAYGTRHTTILRGFPITYFAFQLSASGGSANYNFSSSTMPPGLGCCSHNFGTLFVPLFVRNVIWGRPTAPGTYQFALTVTDSANSAQTTKQFSIVIHNPPPPVVNDTLLPIGTLNSPYAPFRFTANEGLPPLTWSENGALPTGVMLANDGSLSGAPTAAGSFPITVTAQDAAGQNSAPQNFTLQVLNKGWVPAGSMASARVSHTATLLNDGKVLVVGADPGSPAELYNPGTKTFSATGAPVTSRGSQAAVLLNDGKVLIAGGIFGSALSSAEIYDPATGSFTQTSGSMAAARISPTATLLTTGKDAGKVLIVGGFDDTSTAVPSAELFDPATGMFTSVGNTTVARGGHTATALQDGRVLIAGGTVGASAELYDPSSGNFSATNDMVTWRFNHTATLLNDGRVLMAGGQGGDLNEPLTQAEVYDPSTGKFSAVGDMPFARENHTATLLNNGKVLVAGGASGGSANIAISSAELFDPVSGTFSRTADMTSQRMSFTATLLGDGEVLATGGSDNSGAPLASVELYQ